jgi:Na+-transporting NADH:ubiquinone oxidoreductase subunit NqrB
MLLYSNARLMPIVFASAVAIISKAVFRIAGPNGSRHFLNPSNFGITATLLLFPFVGISPPYHFTEDLTGWGKWILPGIIVISGSFLNAKFTRRVPVIVGWFGTPLASALLPMTGVAFVLFTFYMVTDPATTPGVPRGQFLFGLSVAMTYGLLVTFHVVFGLFFGLTLVSLARGVTLWLPKYLGQTSNRGIASQAAAVLARGSDD